MTQPSLQPAPMAAPEPLRIWIVCQYFLPETGAPSARIAGLAKSWLQAGAQVSVLTGIPNHPDGVIPPEYKGKPAYMQEEIGGIPVRRHWLYVAPNRGKWPRVFNMLSFAFSVWWANRRASPCPHVIVASSPNFFCVASAWLLARRHKARFVFEVRDLWPAIFLQMGILRPGFIYNVLERMEMFLYRRADAIVTVTQGFARQIAQRGINPKKITTIFNGVSDADYAAALKAHEGGAVTQLRAKLGLSPLTRVVLYIGNHGEAQALAQVVDAARLLVKRTDVTFLFVGHGAEKEKLQAYAKGVPNIQFLPAVTHGETWTYYAMADINLVCLKNIPDFEMFIPSKMFEIMAAQGCAVAALRGEGAHIMQQSGCAVVVGSEDPDAMAEAIATLLDDPERRAAMAAAGRAFVGRYFLHSRLAQAYLDLMKQLTVRN